MSQVLTQLPDFVEDRISQIIQRVGSTRAEIVEEFNQIYNDPVVVSDAQFKSVEARQRYSIAVLWARYVARPPVSEVEVIPCGFDGLRETKTKKLMSSLYVIAKNKEGNPVLRRISLMGAPTVATMYRNVNIFSRNGAYKYVVKLGSFGDGSDFSADSRTRFTKPTKVPLTPEKFREILGIPLLKIAELGEYPTKKRSDGYMDTTDWRCIRGIIVDENRGTRKDSDIEWGLYRVADETTPPEPYVTSDGRPVSPALTVWTPPELMTYETESECEFYGTISVDKDDIPSMTACLIIPVYARQKTEKSGEKQ